MRAQGYTSSLAVGANSSAASVAVEFLVGSAVITGLFLASALIVAWLTVVAWLTSSLSTTVRAAAPLAKMETLVSQTALKGDRLDSLRSLAGRTLVTTTTTHLDRHSHAPIGCETAFSKLVRTGFSVRCVT
jgi:hypothetical protein